MINESETLITGKFIKNNGVVEGDEACKRIKLLVSQFLIRITSDESGWDTLYKDPNDNRYWELIYPQSELHGGGPPQLVCISNEEATRKYKLS